MRKLLGVLYTALALGANAVHAEVPAEVLALRQGDMQKLTFHAEPAEVPVVQLLTIDDAPATLADHKGKWVVLNFWATWCAPCREEMPSLDRLQAALPEIAVLPVATGRNDPPAISRFYESAGIKTLPILRDPTSQLSRGMAVMALPVTVILNPEGQEVARLIGDAEWDSAAAQAILKALAAAK